MVKKKKELNRIYSLLSVYFYFDKLKEFINVEKSNISINQNAISLLLKPKSNTFDIYTTIMKKDGVLKLSIELSNIEDLSEKDSKLFTKKIKNALKVNHKEIKESKEKATEFSMEGIKKIEVFHETLEINGFFISPIFARIRSKLFNI